MMTVKYLLLIMLIMTMIMMVMTIIMIVLMVVMMMVMVMTEAFTFTCLPLQEAFHQLQGFRSPDDILT